MAERPGESKGDESNTNSTRISGTADIVAASSREAVGPQQESDAQASAGKEREAGASGSESGSSSAGAGSLQAVQAGLGRDCGTDSERAGHSVCVPVLPQVSPRSGAGTRIQKDAARAMEPVAPSGGIGNRWHAH
ncbi:MAG: hypothetical protein WA765_07375 [Candidatus Acidiferrum sp.]